MNKYIIKNCPAHNREFGFCQSVYKGGICKNVSDCQLKQIVQKCEQYKKDYNTTNGVWLLANEITNLLQIRNVNKTT